jgi:hypothetical protein
MRLQTDTTNLIPHIIRVLHERASQERIFSRDAFDIVTASSVLLLFGRKLKKDKKSVESCLILNKRSLKVRQSGDLCCPGGSVAPRLDNYLAKLLSLPIFSLGRWKFWPQWKRTRPQDARLLALFWATALREGAEEMRLNPLAVRFLGPLPPQSLVMFQRIIYPMVAWVPRQKRFYPNWEVDKIVRISLKKLLDPTNYVRYRLSMKLDSNSTLSNSTRDFPCFRFQDNNETELLWGATYRITMVFLEYVFQFRPPPLDDLPVVENALDETYLTGQN